MLGSLFDLKENWVKLALLALFVPISIFVFSPTWVNLVHIWSSSDDYSHGFLLAPLSLYLVWIKRSELQQVPQKTSWLAFPVIIISLFLYVISRYAEILTLAPAAMIMFLASSVAFLFGIRIFKICLFPLFLLFFMIPVPAQIYASLTIPLQLLVTKIVAFSAVSIGIPILREGNVLYLPEHTLEVVRACSGLRSIMSLLTLGVVFSYFTLNSNFLRTFLTLFAIPIAILVNVIRVLLMVVAFYYYDFDLAQGTVHTFLGVVLFAFAVGFFILFKKVLVLCEK